MHTAAVIPVITIEKLEHALPLARALVDGGLPVLEITLRTDCALAAIAAIARELPEAIVGAGTVINRSTYEQALAAGAQFIVSPGYSTELLACAAEHQLPFLPGVNTPGEIMQLLEAGISAMKFFPAELKVKKGDKVVFVNHDLVTHDVTEETKKAWSSSPMATNQTWVLIAMESADYFCSIHPVMKGKIIVEK